MVVVLNGTQRLNFSDELCFAAIPMYYDNAHQLNFKMLLIFLSLYLIWECVCTILYLLHYCICAVL